MWTRRTHTTEVWNFYILLHVRGRQTCLTRGWPSSGDICHVIRSPCVWSSGKRENETRFV